MKVQDHKLKILHVPYRTFNSKSFEASKGFTLIELMVALVLGLLISAAALQIFIPVQLIVDVKKQARKCKTTLSLAFLKYNNI